MTNHSEPSSSTQAGPSAEGKKRARQRSSRNDTESWDAFFQARPNTLVPDDFLEPRGDEPPQERELF